MFARAKNPRDHVLIGSSSLEDDTSGIDGVEPGAGAAAPAGDAGPGPVPAATQGAEVAGPDAPSAAAAGEGSASGDGVSLDEMLARLHSATEGTAPDPAGESRAEQSAAAEHAGLLRATRDAQLQAEEMLAGAIKARSAAVEQAEHIVREAEQAAQQLTREAEREAERTRAEVQGWAAEQRTQVESVVTELVTVAHREAEEMRAAAMDDAMRRAEESAQRYIGELVTRGTRDAESIRGHARQVLERCTEAAERASNTVAHLVTTAGALLADLNEQIVAMERMLSEVAGATLPEEGAERAHADRARSAGLADGPQGADAAGHDGAHEGAHDGAHHGGPEAAPSARPLGSLFLPNSGLPAAPDPDRGL
jgi:vacuolar-type H+-ATPase subunit H